MKKSSQMKAVNMIGALLDILTIHHSYCTEYYGNALFEVRPEVSAKKLTLK